MSPKNKIQDEASVQQWLAELEALLVAFSESFFQEWIDTHRKKLMAFSHIQKHCLAQIENTFQAGFHTADFFSVIENSIQQFIKDISDLEYVKNEPKAEEFSIGLKKQLSEKIENLPQYLVFKIPVEYWKIHPADPIKIRLWKRLKKIHISMASLKHTLLNLTRTLFRKPKQPVPEFYRQFETILFLQRYFEIPLIRFVFEKWRIVLQIIGHQINQIHEDTDDTISQLLFVKELQTILEHIDVDSIKQKLKLASEKINNFNIFSEKLVQFNSDLKNQVSEYRTELIADLTTKLKFANTFILPSTKFKSSKIQKQWQRFENDYNRFSSAWALHFKGVQHDWLKDLELSLLQVQTAQIVLATLSTQEQKLGEQILTTFVEPQSMIQDSLKKFQTLKVSTDGTLKSEILAENRKMLRLLRRDKLPAIIDHIHQSQLGKVLDNYLSRIHHIVENIPDEHTVFREDDFSNIVPESKLVDIPLKSLILEEIYAELNKKHKTLTSEFLEKLEQTIRDISEIDQIIEFNLESALEILKTSETAEDLNQAHEIVVEGLERSQRQIHDLYERLHSLSGQNRDSLIRQTSEFMEQVQALSDNEKVMDLKLRIARTKTREEFRNQRHKLMEKFRQLLPSVVNFVQGALQNIRRSYLHVRKLTGFATTSTDVELKLTKIISESQRQLDRLPFVYQRLFRFDPLEDDRFFAGRENELERMKNIFDFWKQGEFAATALVGEKGAGRTTMINFCKGRIFKSNVIFTIDFEETVYQETQLFPLLAKALKKDDCPDWQTLEDSFLEENQKVVVIVENIHKLFLRIVDGFEALERFLLFVSATQENIFWLVSCGLYAWRYLDKVIQISRNFQHIMFMQELTHESIENIILKRHRVSGYQLEFEAPESFKKNRKFQNLKTNEDQQKYLKDDFFERLNDLVAGNVTVAFLHWLRAIKEISKGKVFVSPLSEIDNSALQQLPVDDLFAFNAFLQHEILTPEQLALILNQPLPKSLLMINRMRNKGVLYKKSQGYQIHLLLYRPIVKTLTVHNIIH